MALTLNGTDQYAHRAKSAVNYQTSVYSMFAYVKRDAVDAFAAIFGTDLSAINETGIQVRAS